MSETTLEEVLESLRAASTDGWLLVYGGLNGGPSFLLEIQNGQIFTQRERMPVDDLNDYSDDLSDHSTDDVRDDVPF